MKKQNKKKYLVAASALALLALGAGTFAWFMSEDQAVNKFEGQLAANDIEIVETFVPEKDWEPGEGVEKAVAVANVSEYDSFIRVSFAESLELLKDNQEIRFDGTNYNRGGVITTTAPVNPILVPSPTDYTDAPISAADVTADLAAPVADITVGTKTYKFHLFAKTDVVTSSITYYPQWINTTDAADKGKAYIANRAGVISYDAGTTKYTIAAGTIVYISLIDKDYDTPKTADWATAAVATPPILPTSPVANVFNGLAEATTTAEALLSNFQLTFTAANLAAVPTANKWFYNVADGYFYYVGIVKSQQSTPQLLDTVTLNAKASNEYSLLKYDLTVNAKGVQAVAGSVEDNWSLTGDLLAEYNNLLP